MVALAIGITVLAVALVCLTILAWMPEDWHYKALTFTKYPEMSRPAYVLVDEDGSESVIPEILSDSRLARAELATGQY